MIFSVNCLKNVKKIIIIKKKATLISKTIQNELLSYVRKYILECINKKTDEEGTPYFSVVADEVTDYGHWEQLRIVIRYVYQQKLVERLLEYVKCDNIRGETIDNLIIKSLKSVLTFHTAVLRLTMVQEIWQENKTEQLEISKKNSE